MPFLDALAVPGGCLEGEPKTSACEPSFGDYPDVHNMTLDLRLDINDWETAPLQQGKALESTATAIKLREVLCVSTHLHA